MLLASAGSGGMGSSVAGDGSLCPVFDLDDPADLMHALEQVGHFVRRQVAESGHDARRHDEYVYVARARISVCAWKIVGAFRCAPHAAARFVLGAGAKPWSSTAQLTPRHNRLEVDQRKGEPRRRLEEDLARDVESRETESRERGHLSCRTPEPDLGASGSVTVARASRGCRTQRKLLRTGSRLCSFRKTMRGKQFSSIRTSLFAAHHAPR